MTESTNPLRHYFRQPAIYTRLPSNGKFWKEGAVSMPANGELPVYPMTAVDEITTRTPDALYNGSAVVRIMHSCIPEIKDAWELPATDLDSLLVAVRMATYGQMMDIDTVCPHCQHEQQYGLDLLGVMENISLPDYETPLEVNGLQFHFRPLTYFQMNETNLSQLQDQNVISQLGNAEMEDAERMHQLGGAFKRITALTVRTMAMGIASIRTPDTLVTDTNSIEEFLNNCDRKAFNAIRDYAIKLREASEIKPLTIKCSNCQTEFKQSFTLDMSNFFVNNS